MPVISRDASLSGLSLRVPVSVMANYLIVETAPRRNGHAVVTSANMHSSCGTTHRQGPAQYRPD